MTDIGPDLRTNRSGIQLSIDHEFGLIPLKREKWKSQFDWTIMETMADYNFIFVVKLSLGKIGSLNISEIMLFLHCIFLAMSHKTDWYLVFLSEHHYFKAFQWVMYISCSGRFSKWWYCIRLAHSTVESESVWKSFADVLTKYYSISEDTLTWTAQICLGQRLNKFPLLILMAHMIWVISITQILTRNSWVFDIDTSGGIFDRPEATASNCFSFMWLDNFWCFCEIILLGQE